MRYSAWMLAAFAAAGLSAGQAPHRTSSPASFCGSISLNWIPPWQRKPVRAPGKDGLCHLLLCERRKMRGRSPSANPDV
ncbi:hypothetical protein [Sphingobium herbicidovorans]|uniref:hypothetical protein n=1 Tax=Sphingobium herbicidovorans TaxID=76947 RepID=UPI000AB43B89|nr:hypothetical protein [Sphingobium herbicidovorans]